MVKRLAEVAGVSERVATPHAIKHSRVQHLLEAAEQSTDLGAQKVLLAAAQVVGHQSAQTTIKHYAAATAGERALLKRVTEEALE